jgi:acyl-CoA reductase-like NAD-dependent aldehyde dehydrogenase
MGDATGTPLNPADYENKIFLNGAYTAPAPGTKTYSLKNPKDNTQVVSSIPLTTIADIDLAVSHAEAALAVYSKVSAIQRTECLYRLGHLVDEHMIPILTLDSYTSGNPVSLIPTREKGYIKNGILYFAGWTDKLVGDYLPADDGKKFLLHNLPTYSCPQSPR